MRMLHVGSRTSGFLRFLHLLSVHPWREQALIVDPNAELSAADREAAMAKHSKVKISYGLSATWECIFVC